MATLGSTTTAPIRLGWAESITGLVRRTATLANNEWRARPDNGWIGLVAVPLAMSATGLLSQWWAWPILVGITACLTRSWRWSWVLSLEMAWVGTAWSYIGACCFGEYPHYVLLLGAAWTSVPAMLAATAWDQRRRRRAWAEYQRLW